MLTSLLQIGSWLKGGRGFMNMRFRFSVQAWLLAYFVCIQLLVIEVKAQGEEPDQDKWTPELQMRFKRISGITLSPDGKYVAYEVREPLMEGEKSEYLSHIWVAATDGSFNIQYTRGEKSATRPSFSPDSQYLSFTSSREGEKDQIWIMRIHGGEAYKLTDEKSAITSYKWSPDGKFIAFIMADPETEEEEKEKKEKRDVILVDKNYKYNHLYKISVINNGQDKRESKRLTTGKLYIVSFDWSPDGKRIVFAHQPDPLLNTQFLDQDISTVPADSGKVTPLVTRPGIDGNPLYSTDGKWVAFISHSGSPQPVGLGDAYLISSGGGEINRLADTHDRNITLIGWTVDSENLLYSEYQGASLNIFSLPVNGDPPSMITTGNGNFSYASFDRNTDLMAFAYENTDTPVEVYSSPVNRFKMNRLSSINTDIPKPEIGKTELIKWKSKDGKQVEGLLTYPVDYQEGRKYPLILNVHGGPAGVFSQNFTGGPGIYMIQSFAQNGYAVIRPNPRGSSGYGKDFRFANFKDWGYGDYEDLMAGVDKVIEMGIGHADSLCIMGWSYGGYMTSFAVTRTDRFKAASMGAGLPNLISMVTTTDIPDFIVAHMGGEFWENYKNFESHSAIYRIGNVTTPTQVIHGAEDLRVPFAQGQEFYVALKRLGVPTEMVVYPRTPHGPSEPKFLMDVTPRILTWFDNHLGRMKKKDAELNVK